LRFHHRRKEEGERAMIASVTHQLRARSATALRRIEGSLRQMVAGWLLLVGLALTARLATSPVVGALAPETAVAFLMLAAAPVVSGVMAMRWFANPSAPAASTAPAWRAVSPAAARRHRLYGAGGIMVSLLCGLLLNIVLRAFEYLTALPALSGEVPHWLAALQLGMTADVVLLTALYAIAFVAALRRAPIFPALLMAIWGLDLAMQLAIRTLVLGQPDLPDSVGGALAALLDGNVSKVLISVALWLPYLLLSTRVNLTYRHRLPR
jgi:hypothetical protein